jgi:hypothetical protein
VVKVDAVDDTTAPVNELNVEEAFQTYVEAPAAVSVPFPQKTPPFDAEIVTVGLLLTVALTEEDVTESPETEQVIMHR